MLRSWPGFPSSGMIVMPGCPGRSPARSGCEIRSGFSPCSRCAVSHRYS